VVVEVAVTSWGGALLICTLLANQQWLDRHFLPTFFLSRSTYVLVETVVRVAIAALGAALALAARPRISRFIAHRPARALNVMVAVVLAFGASELILRVRNPRAAMVEEEPTYIEPSRRLDPRLGWAFVPSRTGRDNIGGRVVVYAIDSAGYRVRRVDEPVDPGRPTIVFTGESMMFGEGLTWEETIPAQTGAIMGMQSANLAVSGFASDQAYLRLQAELPRFRRPVAVVTLFTSALFDRNLNDDRPHLGPGLIWLPAVPRWRLATIGKFLVPYRSEETIESGITVTREALQATVALARARGAVPIIVVPQFTPEEPRERALRRRILDETGLSYVWVELDPNWRIPDDGHPDPRAAQAIAVAIAARLRER
jgi:hypothetical protein